MKLRFLLTYTHTFNIVNSLSNASVAPQKLGGLNCIKIYSNLWKKETSHIKQNLSEYNNFIYENIWDINSVQECKTFSFCIFSKLNSLCNGEFGINFRLLLTIHSLYYNLFMVYKTCYFRFFVSLSKYYLK
ncbi:Protein of unknown function [Gryllus bimaculatus]|nr:Protein of unknown function [Gryllus bimaculatus]